jgi:flagellar biosynthesis/type III secretory pathway protein FliH
MTARFRPPPLARFYAGDGADHAAALIQAREEGFAEGRALGAREGHTAGRAEGETQTRDAMGPELDALYKSSAKRERYDAVADALRHLITQREADLAAREILVRDVAIAALRTLFPVLLSHAAGPEIAALLAAAVNERGHETLTLRAHPDTLAAVASETASAADDGRLILAPDERRAFGAVEIGWTGGGLTFDPDALLAQVASALAIPPIAARSIPAAVPPDLVPPAPEPPAPFQVPELPIPEPSKAFS